MTLHGTVVAAWVSVGNYARVERSAQKHLHFVLTFEGP